MKYWSFVIARLPANAMALYPFLLFKTAAFKQSVVVINHEKIHFRQQQEMLILLFYPVYFLNYLINLFRYKNHYQAYFHICFEKEAYANERNFQYLSERKPFAWIRYL
jgi:hypothetical protein